jgi:predicted ATPase
MPPPLRSAFVEAVAQATHALTLLPALPSTLGLRRKQIELQVSLAVAQMSTRGMSAAETRASFEQARLFIERAEALGDPPDDPLLLFRILSGLWSANYVGFHSDAMRQQAAHCLALADKQHATLPRIMGHRLTGTSLMWTGEVREGLAHLDRAIGLYDHADDALATHIGKDYWVAALAERSVSQWILGYPDAATRDGKRALKDARVFGRAAPLMYALNMTSIISVFCGERAKASAHLDECIALATKQGALAWKKFGAPLQGHVLALTGRPADAVRMISTGVSAMRSGESGVWIPFYLTHLAWAYAELNQLPDAWRCIDEALTEIKTTKEKWFEAEINRVGGEIALKPPKPEAAKAEAFFERALTVARDQDAKSWELRAAMSMARLWRDQGKQDEGRDLLAAVYGWFSEGFETLDLLEAKGLLNTL